MISEIKDDLPIAIELIWKVFLEYEAPYYEDEGIEEFRRSINNQEWINKKKFYGYYDNSKLVGVIATNEVHHISLLFVDGNYHKHGIGKALFNYIKQFNDKDYFTVNSSINGHEFYKKMGFVDTNSEQCIHGIRFFPMKLDL